MPYSELGEIPEWMIKRRSSRYQKYQTQEAGESYRTNRSLETYDQHLPKLGVVSLKEYLTILADQKPHFHYLDIGCGQGISASQVKRDYPKAQVHCLSARDYRKSAPRHWQPFLGKIDYRIENAHNIGKIFSGLSFDAIVSVESFENLGDPLAVFADAISLLDGIFFIDRPGLYLTTGEADKLRMLWQARGIEFTLNRWSPMVDSRTRASHDLAIEHSAQDPKIPLPFRYNPNQPANALELYQFDLNLLLQ